ncbi:integrase catalytic domain-containing protein [Trichonephila clavipes]|nr:integrase catalytic domain-containing protein [Trichonephila clavipes]
MLKIDWTDLLPDTINREWRQFAESLQVVNDININRCIVLEQPEVIELHGFSDASQSAYGAVVYCKSITSDGKMLVYLIASKSRVAPTKQTTIPSRLELCAAVLLAKLVHRVKQALKLNVTNTFLWSDSMIVLSWIRKESYQLKAFVANRIATIQEMTSSEQWRYVATEDNPADFVSRGMDSLKLKTCELWWNGPKFLMSNQYPQRQIPVAVIKDPGRSITSIVETDLTNLNENRLDNWQKITKIIQLIWKRWSVDYLNSLQQRNKWHFEKKNAKIGDMVIIKEDNLPSCQWSLGRINNIYPGKDSKVRVVEVKTTRARATIDLLKDTLGDRLISRFGPVNWPPRFCDLKPLDYFLWGYVKSLVYADKPQTLDHLEDNICRVIADIRPQMLEKVIENWTSRLDYIRASRGSPMPEIIFKM